MLIFRIFTYFYLANVSKDGVLAVKDADLALESLRKISDKIDVLKRPLHGVAFFIM